MDNQNNLTHKDTDKSAAEGIKRARANSVQLQQRVNLVAELLIKGFTVSRIKEECKTRFKIKGRLVESYLSRARELILDQGRTNLDYERAEAILRYKTIISNEKIPVKDRLRACQLLDQAQGVAGPRAVVNVNTQNNLTVNQSEQSSVFDRQVSEQLALIIEEATAEEFEVVSRIMDRIQCQ